MDVIASVFSQKDKDNVQKNINLGYLDAMKAYDRYEGIKYYFNVDYMFDEEYCFNKFKSLKIETIENILNLFNIKKDPTLRTLLEVLIPKLGENLGLDKDFSYKDLFYCIYEKKLEENNINRIQLYDFHKLYDVVNKNINENKNISLTYETISIIPIPCFPPSLFNSRSMSDTFIFLPLTDVGTPFSNVIVTYSPSSGAFSGETPNIKRCS